jgi:hypothetical protein
MKRLTQLKIRAHKWEALCVLFCLSLCFLEVIRQTHYVWDGGTGNWTDPLMWIPDEILL